MIHQSDHWHHSPQRLYQECWTRHFLQKHVDPSLVANCCNVGVGRGEFDDYLGLWLHGHGRLTSVDIDEHQVHRLLERQAHEGHPNPSDAIHADLLQAQLGPFDLVTMTGSTLHETHAPSRALRCAEAWVRPGGFLLATVIHDLGDPDRLLSELGGVVTTERFADLAGAEFTAVLAKRPSA